MIMRDNMGTKPVLSVQNLTISFGHGKYMIPAISNLNFAIQPGECLGLVGESGSGKSMTALAIMQLLPHTARVSSTSKILLNGNDLLLLSERNMRKVRGQRIGMIFQDAMSAFNPVLTIGHQIIEVIQIHLKLSKRNARKKAYRLLEEVGIPDPKHTYRSYAHELSGGMRQRAMIALALSANPTILIADEPTTALDVTIQAQVLTLLKSLQAKHKMTLLFISHDLAVVSQLANEIVVLQHGVKVEQAQAAEFFHDPKHAYSKQLINAIPSETMHYQQSSPTETLLHIEKLRVYFPIRSTLLKRTIGYIKAVDDISFQIAKGHTLALVGESGSGKTTTAKAILKLLKTTAGRILFNNKNISNLTSKELFTFRNDMQIIFQDPYAALNPRIMIGDSIAEGLVAQKKIKNYQAAHQIVDELLQQVDLSPEMKWRYPHEFSGGQRQRICIARALALQPKLLVLDEPTSALDVSIQMQILKLLQQLQQKNQISYLLITHNLSIVAYMAHYVAVMKKGKIVEQGRTHDLLSNPQKAYTRQLLASVPKILVTEKTKIKSS